MATEHDRVDNALRDLNAALTALLPDEGSARHADHREALAIRIAADTMTTADIAILVSLPPEALATLGMTPAAFVTWLQSIDDRI